jgi:hypothetical protein
VNISFPLLPAAGSTLRFDLDGICAGSHDLQVMRVTFHGEAAGPEAKEDDWAASSA